VITNQEAQMKPRSTPHTAIRTALFALLLFALPAFAHAQAIGGVVRDESGAVLPGVTVEARSPVLIEQMRSAVTDSAGNYLITGLTSGAYSVTFTLEGFNRAVREGIQLSAGFTANVSVTLAVGSLAETITVSGSSPLVDVQGVSQQVAMNREFLDDIPSGKSFQNLGILVPGMVSSGGNTGAGSDVGGQGGQTQFKLGIHGGDPNDQNLTVDGMGQESGQNGGADSMAWLADGNYSEIVMNYSANSAEIETGGVRVNLIPREGGNKFSGSFSGNLSGPDFQADNVDADLIARGLPANSANRVSKMWRWGPTIGGPIKRNTAWFHFAHTSNRTDSFAAGVFPDSNTSDLDYTPTRDNPKSQSVDDQLMRSNATKLTYQMTSKDKFGLYYERTTQRRAHFFIGGQAGRIGEEASIDRGITTNTTQITWTRPATTRLLFEGGIGLFRHYSVSGTVPTVPRSAIPSLLLSSSGGTAYVNGFASWFPRNPGEQIDHQMIETYRGSVSYVTGTHAFKVGFQLQNRELDFEPRRYHNVKYVSPGYVVDPVLRNTIANGAQFFVNSEKIEKDVRPLGIYAQDKWTLRRLTVNVGVRFDGFTARFPDGEIETSQYRAVPFPFDGDQPYAFKDLQPRLGVVYDIFGNGKTALKASANRYADQLTNDILDNLTPSDVAPMTRAWRDFNGDGIIQGDPLNTQANGEFILNDGDPNFGLPVLTVSVDPEYGKGWGMRTANWEYSGSVEHELLSNVQVEFAYYYRKFFLNEALDNVNLSPADYDTFSVTVPADPRLPNGGGYVISGLYDLKPTSLGRPTRVVRTAAEQFGGGPIQTWKGVDFTANARLKNLTLRGGISAGGQHNDTCAYKGALPELTGRGEWCESDEVWKPRGSVIAAYNFPYQIQVSGTMTSSPGPIRMATMTLPVSATTLGRPLSGSLTVNAIEPGTVFGERATTFDLRFTKFFRLGPTRTRFMVDLYNAFNNNAATREEYVFTPNGRDNYLTPGTILPGRLVKLAFQTDF
jgi:hypothetical protein